MQSHAQLAQLDRALASGAKGRRFDSCTARHICKDSVDYFESFGEIKGQVSREKFAPLSCSADQKTAVPALVVCCV